MRRSLISRHCLILLAFVAGCAAPPVAPPPAPSLDHAAWYLEAARAGKAVYRIDAQQSLITVTVRRGGPLARFGHDHVIASRSVEGFAAPGEGRVDEPALRLAAGLHSTLSNDALAGTRANMLARVLEADRFPVVYLRARRPPDSTSSVRLEITLHGVTRSVDVPTRIERTMDTIAASGELTLLQTDFGIKPMSVMGGAMVVQDKMELAFRIHARRHR